MNTYAVLTKRKQFLEQMHSLSLQRLIGATNAEYLQMLKDCGFAVEKRSQHGVSMQFRLTPFQNFVTTQGLIGVETEKAKVKGMKKAYFLRIGRKQPGYCKSVLEQVRSGIPGMPRISALGQVRRQLRRIIGSADTGSESESSGSSDTDDSQASNDEQLDTPTTCKYPILQRLGIQLDLSVEKNDVYVMDIIGECLALQSAFDQRKKKKATNRYRRPKKNQITYAISVIPQSEKAYTRYHRKTPFIQEFIEVMEMDPEHSVDGAGRLARYLARKHSNLYTTVGQECGFGLVGIMGEVEAAAMWRDARLMDSQA